MTKPALRNTPDIWLECFPRPALRGHKYNRGLALILGAPSLTGATRLAASACSRIGAGLVSVLAQGNADIYRMTLPADIMVKDAKTVERKKTNVVLGGCGGLHDKHRKALLHNEYKTPRVFDADAIPDSSGFSCLDEHCVLTPHSGEFARTFSYFSGSPEEMAASAAQATGAVLVLKGPETVIAHPDGRTLLNDHASPYLAKAGTGDVLAGMITGLIAQNMPIFEACGAAVWIHGEAAQRFGPGLIATDIPDLIPAILKDLLV